MPAIEPTAGRSASSRAAPSSTMMLMLEPPSSIALTECSSVLQACDARSSPDLDGAELRMASLAESTVASAHKELANHVSES